MPQLYVYEFFLFIDLPIGYLNSGISYLYIMLCYVCYFCLQRSRYVVTVLRLKLPSLFSFSFHSLFSNKYFNYLHSKD